ncbi:MAG: NAD(P)-binding domain-containing protein [Clostridia bacterium]|nr:NAD(P)-binding domain-containing protein [Clostridia bacterium]
MNHPVLGFIGYGSMGSMLINGFLARDMVEESNILISTRSPEKAASLKEKHPGVIILESNRSVAEKVDILFLCIKPVDFSEVLTAITDVIRPNQHVISIAGMVPINTLEGRLKAKISKVIPTVVSEVLEGVSLLCHGTRVTDENKAYLKQLLMSIGTVCETNEAMLPLYTELTSCGPGFFASFIEEFILSAMRHDPSLTYEAVSGLVVQTLYGTGRLMADRHFTPQSVVKRVATKGGITEEGVKVFEEKLPHVLDELFDKTLQKRSLMAEKVDQMFK